MKNKSVKSIILCKAVIQTTYDKVKAYCGKFKAMNTVIEGNGLKFSFNRFEKDNIDFGLNKTAEI